MSAEHYNKLTSYLHAEAKGGVYVQEHVLVYRKPDEVPYRTIKLMRRRDNTELAKVRYQVLPGCCGVLLLHNFGGEQSEVLRLIQIVKAAAKRANYGLVLYSLVQRGQEVAANPIAEFTNPKTNNIVALFGLPTGAEYARPERLEDS